MNTTSIPKPFKDFMTMFGVGFFTDRFSRDSYFNDRLVGYRTALYTLDSGMTGLILWEYIYDVGHEKVYYRGLRAREKST